ncbi:PAS domain S-box-containing protein [Desulfonauticus submarinus]|uniref:histidine kinase n=1 Tax=Desulfonauticus submarinus TaxID=206665 RepID=A0A1G9ZQM8_9BACT|nr:transporter substrate-binding domain-containing protein [Desulfonauticus submarinus]SDN22906.1 PAS domain S-box-containing protein [Desulfonauticus submarinus]
MRFIGLSIIFICLFSEICFAQKIVVVGDKNYAPFEFLDANNIPQGISVDIWKLWSKKTGIKVEYRLMEWNKALEAVKNGEADVVGGIFYSKKRNKFFDFSNPYFSIDTRVFFSKKIFGLKNLNLKGFEVGVVKGDYAEEFLKTKYPHLRLKDFSSIDDLVKVAITGKINVFVGDRPVVLFYLAKYNKMDSFKYSNDILYEMSLHAAVKKGNKKLLSIVKQGFDLISKEEIDKIVKEWTGINEYKIFWRKYKIVFITIIWITVFFFILSIIFKLQVKKATKKINEQNKQLKEINERLNITLESIGDGVIATDSRGKITMFNSVAEELTGWKRDEALGTSFDLVFEIVNEKTGEKGISPFEKVLNTGKIVGLANHTALIRKDGKRLPILDSGAPIKTEQGEIIGVVIVFRDATPQRKRENELIRMEKLESLSLIASGIAHDFNNLLTAMIANIDLLKRGISEEKDMQRLSRIERASFKAKEMVQRLMVFAKNWEPVKKGFFYTDKLRETVEFILAGSGIKVEFNISEDLFPIFGSETQISQVIENIVLNAREAMHDNGILKVSAENFIYSGKNNKLPLNPGEYIKIKIEDSGPGIPPEIREHIFEPYFSTKEKGSGLGLAVSHQIVEDHKGYLELVDTEQGACFVIYLPKAEVRVKDKQKENLFDLDLTNKKILFLDDEELIREMMQDAFSELNAHIDTFALGEDAYKAYERSYRNKQPYDLVFLDLTIPGGIGGKEVGERILALNPQAKMVLVSGYSDSFILKNYKKYGFCAMLRKPFSIDELVHILRKII